MKSQLATIKRSWDSTLDKNLNLVYGQMDIQTYARTDNPNALCRRRTEAAGGIKIWGVKYPTLQKLSGAVNSWMMSLSLCPATRKWRVIMLYPPKFWVSVRPSVCLSVRPSVRPSAPTTILVSATPPTVLGQSFWNFTGVLRIVWRYAYCFFRILKLFFITFFPFLT